MRHSIQRLVDSPLVQRKIHLALYYASFFLLLFGAKLWIISAYGSPVPFGDQWDAEAAGLYKPYLDHTLSWNHMVSPHNEHRIFTTRVLSLLLLKVNKLWSPLLQMVVNAALHTAVIILIVGLVKRVIGRANLPAMLAFAFALFCLPCAWENTVVGFQAQFYFVILFNVLALWLLIGKEPLSPAWWIGILCAILSFLSLASGVFSLAAATLVSLVIFFGGLRRNMRQLVAIIILAILFFIAYRLTPQMAHHAQLKASSIRQLFNAISFVYAWPLPDNFFFVLVCNSPIAIFCIHMLRKKPAATDRRWFLFALVLCAAGQMLSIAYGRAAVVGAPRYRDLFAVLVLTNFACLLAIGKEYMGRWRRLATAGIFAWTAIIVTGVGVYATWHLPVELSVKQQRNAAEETNTRNYLSTGDINMLKNKPEWDIPYPDANILAERISLPGIREIMPAAIRPSLKPDSSQVFPVSSFSGRGYYFTTPNRSDSTWGSYTSDLGDASKGEFIWRFNAGLTDSRIAIPVAGYPRREGILMEIEQNGKRKKVSVGSDPHETWKTVFVNVKKGEFSIRLTDSSPSTWIAIGTPRSIGKLDPLVNWMLAYYYAFLLMGIAGVIILMLWSEYVIKKSIKVIQMEI